MTTLEIREKHRLEWENIVISYINRGYSKGEAMQKADDSFMDDEGEDFEDWQFLGNTIS